MLTRTARRGLPAMVLVAVGLVLTACGPDDSASSSAPSSSDGSSAMQNGGASAPGKSDQSNASGTAGTSDSKDSVASAPGAIAACATSKLKTTAENVSSAAGHTTFQLVFQNTGTATCAMTGYPGVSFVKIHNTQLGKAAARTAGSAKAVTLIPNAHAYADVQTVNGQGGYSAAECGLATVPTLRVYPPNQTESTNIPWNAKECVGPDIQNLRVGPVHANK